VHAQPPADLLGALAHAGDPVAPAVLLQRRGVETDAVVGDADLQLGLLGELDADALRPAVTCRVRHGLADDPQQRLARRRSELQPGDRVRFDTRAPPPGRLAGHARERLLERLVGRADERRDHGARLVERAAGRRRDVGGRLRRAVARAQRVGLLGDEREVLCQPVVDLARQPAAFVQRRGSLELALGAADLVRAAGQQGDEEPQPQHVAGVEVLRVARRKEEVVQPREGTERRPDREPQLQRVARELGVAREPDRRRREQPHDDDLQPQQRRIADDPRPRPGIGRQVGRDRLRQPVARQRRAEPDDAQPDRAQHERVPDGPAWAPDGARRGERAGRQQRRRDDRAARRGPGRERVRAGIRQRRHRREQEVGARE
jgi:hypothetical protein